MTDDQAELSDEHTSVRAGTRLINRELGMEEIRALHRENLAIDATVGVGLLVAVVANGLVLGSTSFGLAWIGLLVLQGFLFQVMAFFAHDAFVHRNVGGHRVSRILGPVFVTPTTQLFSEYHNAHLVHHRTLNTADDSEEYKLDFNRRWVKFAMLTIVGTQMSWLGGFRNTDRPAWKPEYTDAERRRVRNETIYLVLWIVGVIAAAFIWPRPVLLGYVLPLTVIAPIASNLRVILEHADSDPTDPINNATYYRTGWISGPLFFWDSGDCHLVHHLYPSIPFYRMRRACRVMRPVLLAAGAREHRSFLALLKGWFIDNRPHGTPWASAT